MHHSVASVHILLQVSLDKLEDQRQRVVRVNDVVQSDDVCVLEILEEGDLTNGGTRGALFMFKSDLLQCY